MNNLVPLLVFAGLVGLINQFILDDALTDWVANNAEQYWYWGIWILVWLIYIIGDKLLKATSSKGEAVLEKLDEINTNIDRATNRLDRLSDEILWAARDNQSSPTNRGEPKDKGKDKDRERDGPWVAKEQPTTATKRREADDNWHDQFTAPPKEKSKAEKLGNYIRDRTTLSPRALNIFFWVFVIMIALAVIGTLA